MSNPIQDQKVHERNLEETLEQKKVTKNHQL